MHSFICAILSIYLFGLHFCNVLDVFGFIDTEIYLLIYIIRYKRLSIIVIGTLIWYVFIDICYIILILIYFHTLLLIIIIFLNFLALIILFHKIIIFSS